MLIITKLSPEGLGQILACVWSDGKAAALQD